MPKIKLTNILTLFKNRKELLKSLYHFSRDYYSKQEVEQTFGFKKGLPTVNVLDLFPNFEETISHYSCLDGTSWPMDIMLIKKILKQKTTPDYFEFGTWRGESIVNFIGHTKDCYSISFSKEQLRSMGFSNDVINACNFFLKDLSDFKQINHNSQTYDFKDLYGKFDVVFVDADHEYEGVKIDTENAFKLLKDEHSIIIWHDYGKTYETINWQVFHGILDGTPPEKRDKIYKVSNTLCAIYTNQKLKASFPPAYIPNKAFTVNIKAEPILESNAS